MNWDGKVRGYPYLCEREREIRETADALNKADLRHTEVLPLFARLSNSEQNRIFQPHTGRRIAAGHQRGGNLADRSRIKYVIDTVCPCQPLQLPDKKSSVCR